MEERQKYYFDNRIIIVSGLPRSGTSMMMKMLEITGLETLVDSNRQADDFNPNGYYEYEPVKRLKDGHYNWLDNAKGRVIKIVSPLIIYLPKNYHFDIIFMERNLGEIIISQDNMLHGFMNLSGINLDPVLEGIYKQHLEKIKTWISIQENMRVFYVNYNELLFHPEKQLFVLIDFLSLSLDVDIMCSVIDQDLYRSKKTLVEV